MRRFFARTGSVLLALAVTAWAAGGTLMGISSAQAQTTPSYLLYEGRILDGSANPITTAVVMRFSLWKSTDWISSDTTGGGAINTGATQYGGWYEFQTVTPTTNGIVSVQLGASTALPSIDFTQHKYVQVEVKAVGAPDTSYALLDPTGDAGADATDRKFIGSVAYAKNAETLQNRTPGTASGNVLLLGPGGQIGIAQMGSGTNAVNFQINAGNAAGDTTLTFGNILLQETLKFSASNSRFEFSDDVYVGGTLTATGSIATNSGMTINADNSANDAVLTFGNAVAPETLQFSNGNHRFEFSDDVNINGNLTVTGTVNGLTINQIAQSPLAVSAGAGLSVNVASGSYRLGNTIVNYGGITSFPVGASVTSYVFFGSGGLAANTVGFPADESFIPLALVQTSASAVTGVTDRRTMQSDIREHDVTDVLTAEFDKATYQGDATNNVGQLTTTQDNTTKRNYYLWTSTRTTLQDYDIFVRYQLPRTFVRWKDDALVNPLVLHYRSTSANAADNALDISVFDTNGTPVTLVGSTTNLASTSWASTQIEFTGSPTWTPGGEILLKFHLSAKDSYQMHIGSLELRTQVLTGQ